MKQPWIQSPVFDLVWFIAPGLVPVLLLVSFPGVFGLSDNGLSPVSWLLLVLCVDVAHVYSTVYRTYFNPQGRAQYQRLLWLIPLAGWAVGAALCSLDTLLFWRCLSYLAVFHFVRQQYGFLRLYSRSMPRGVARLHSVVIYSATIIPVAIWHCTGPKNFNWFVEGDFLYVQVPALAAVLKSVLAVLLLCYAASELYLKRTTGLFNIPRSLFVVGTAASWYVGIVVFNGDLAFTMLNVLSHGIPYIALIWSVEKKSVQKHGTPFLRTVFSTYGVVLFVGIIVLMGYIEEGLWDAVIWREHEGFFSVFYGVPPLASHVLIALVVPLLALPQIVHYVLDGFIWKQRNRATAPLV